MKSSEHKLLRIKIAIEYEFVGDDIYLSDDIQKAAEDIFRRSRNSIINEAVEEGGLKVTATEITSKEQLPPGYMLTSLPYLDVSFGSPDSDTIGNILNKKL